MRKLLVYLKDYKKETVLAPLFKMLEATFELFVPLVMAAIIDQGQCIICAQDGRRSHFAWYHRACLFYYGTIFCGQSSGGLLHEAETCTLCAYSGSVFHGDRYAGHSHDDHADDF